MFSSFRRKTQTLTQIKMPAPRPSNVNAPEPWTVSSPPLHRNVEFKPRLYLEQTDDAHEIFVSPNSSSSSLPQRPTHRGALSLWKVTTRLWVTDRNFWLMFAPERDLFLGPLFELLTGFSRACIINNNGDPVGNPFVLRPDLVQR